jgi:hypothetical protein
MSRIFFARAKNLLLLRVYWGSGGLDGLALRPVFGEFQLGSCLLGPYGSTEEAEVFNRALFAML